MEPILILCMTPEDYTKWIFHLQKVCIVHFLISLCIFFNISNSQNDNAMVFN